VSQNDTQIPQWSCEIRDAEALTVGKKFTMECLGPSVVLNGEKLELKLQDEEKYALKVLEVHGLSQSSVKLVVTSYKAGVIRLANPLLTDGEASVGLGEVQFKVESVIKPPTGSTPPKEPSKGGPGGLSVPGGPPTVDSSGGSSAPQQSSGEVKAFPPWGPLQINWPSYVWLLLACVIIICSWSLFCLIRAQVRTKRFFIELKKHNSALSPLHQFNKELRVLARNYNLGAESAGWSAQKAVECLKELDLCFRWYIAREFLLPVIDLSPVKIVNMMAKHNARLDREIGRDLLIALKEITRAKLDKVSGQSSKASQVSNADVMQLVELCRKLADSMAKAAVLAEKARSS
jgi:hypothetical protein